MATARYGTGLLGLLKRGWHELPDIVAGTGMALLGIGMGFGALYNVFVRKGGVRKYRNEYTVIRPDDPLVDYYYPKKRS